MIQNPFDWYWLADDGRLFYTGGGGKLTTATDPDFVARKTQWEGPDPSSPWWVVCSTWPKDGAGAQTNAALQAVMTPYGIAVETPTLATTQAALTADVDVQAEAQRLRYVTPGACQMATYLLKRSQALQALAAQGANTTANMTADALAAAYPYLVAEIGITVDPTTKAAATDVYGVARAVSALAAVWQQLDIAIERVRLGTKAAISAATTAVAAQAAHDAVAWPAPPNS